MGGIPPFLIYPSSKGGGTPLPPLQFSHHAWRIFGYKTWRCHRASLLALSRFCVNFCWLVRKENVEKKIVGVPVQLCECEGRRGGGKTRKGGEDACGKSGNEDGGEKGRDMATDESKSCGGIYSNVFVGYRLRRKRLPPPRRKKKIQKMLNKALVKRVIPFIFKNRVWTMDQSLWPISLVDFRELDTHLAVKLPKIHAGHQWQMIIYFYKEIKREQEEWRRLEELERNAMEAHHRVMEL